MSDLWEILKAVGIVGAFVIMIFVVQARRKQYQKHVNDTAEDEICDHLRPVLDEMKRRGHTVRKIGQRMADAPMEIFLTPPFDAAAIRDELKLAPPVFLSERGVLYCQECWCEISGVNW